MVPFIKWAGGKRQLLSELKNRIPQVFNTYFEPFIGGGALLYKIRPENAVIADMNKDLIKTYQALTRKPKKVLELLILMEWGHSEHFYKKIRSLDKLSLEDQRGLVYKNFSKQLIAARFIYLNKSCFNGLYRVNSRGFFNVPWNKKLTIKTYEVSNINEIVQYFQKNKIKILRQDFAQVAKMAQKGDFVYFDPPYDYEVGINGFKNYQKEGFNQKDQIRLASLCHQLDKKEVKFMLSNHNTALIREIYKDFRIEVIHAKRLINSNASKRGRVEEVIVRNYVS